MKNVFATFITYLITEWLISLFMHIVDWDNPLNFISLSQNGRFFCDVCVCVCALSISVRSSIVIFSIFCRRRCRRRRCGRCGRRLPSKNEIKNKLQINRMFCILCRPLHNIGRWFWCVFAHRLLCAGRIKSTVFHSACVSAPMQQQGLYHLSYRSRTNSTTELSRPHWLSAHGCFDINGSTLAECIRYKRPRHP